MKLLQGSSHTLLLLALLGAAQLAGARRAQSRPPAETRLINVSTAKSSLTLVAAGDGRLYQLSYGRLRQAPAAPAREDEFYPPSGNGFILEPAVQVVHADGNTSADLVYVSHETSDVDADV